MGSTIFSIGHSNRSIEAFLALLAAHDIANLVDIRTVPKSHHNPQFEGERLNASLAQAGITYLHEPLLGGLRRPHKESVNAGWRNSSFRGYADYMATADFKRGLASLMETAARGATAMMCAEAVPWRCHRSLVADALMHQGWSVLDIVGPGKPSTHRYTPFLHIENGELTYPAPPAPPDLFA